MDPPSARHRRLTQLFHGSLAGERQIKGAQDARRFLEAANAVCQDKGPSYAIEKIVSSAKGIEMVSVAVRSGLSADSINAALGLLVKHLVAPQAKAVADGQFLGRLLAAMLSPPTFWSALLQAHRDGVLEDANDETFAQVCLEIVSAQQPGLEASFREVRDLMDGKSLLEAPSPQVRLLACRIQKILQLSSGSGPASLEDSPGGRHDNDFADFRQIAIYPTADEMRSTEEPFLQRLYDVFAGPKESRARTYRDWLFRLLREDMLAELREDLRVACGQQAARRKLTSLSDLGLSSSNTSQERRSYTLNLTCGKGVAFPRGIPAADKQKFLKENNTFMRHNSFGALCCGTDAIAFGSLLRDVALLSMSPPVVVIQFTDAAGLRKALEELLGPKRHQLKFFIVNTPTFAYEPILQRLKDMTEVALEGSLLDPKEASDEYQPPEGLEGMLGRLKEALRDGKELDLSGYAASNRPIRVRGAQLQSLVNGLESSLGQIQGPPGTGKSFIGALIVLLILRLTSHRVLVLSYTNHALDQFLEDLLDVGIEADDMVRLGSKSSARTEPLALQKYTKQQQYWSGYDVRASISEHKEKASQASGRLEHLLDRLMAPVTDADVLEMLEFSPDDSAFWTAFQVPDQRDGFVVAGKRNKSVRPGDLYELWKNGKHLKSLDSLKACINPASYPVWTIPHPARRLLHDKWSGQLRLELMNDYVEAAETHSQLRRQLDTLFDDNKRNVMRSKRVIGCTTTAAAMYQSTIKAAKPDVVLVEEAGEILEAHVFTALGPSVKQLILIGDHKQLRPKINSYKLTEEKGDGFDLNVSLFERLIRQGHGFTALEQQHRSHPEISHFTRLLAYERLEDGAKTLTRPRVRGLRARVAFVHHERSEDQLLNVADRWEPGSKESKSNAFEADMVLKTVKYLGQQGYTSDRMVVLTPYLGQLSLLRRKLGESHDPYLNDVDHAELVRAGLMTPAAAQVNKTRLRLSTIDNYQGEESDIVIVSLTRSNAQGDIGFLCSRERLVVLMSRARDGIILFGNMHTFMKSKKGGKLWKEYFEALKDKECLFEGVPVHCEQHPERCTLLKSPEDFDLHCPDGGCAQPCGVPLTCGQHTCNRRCHRLPDHSRVACTALVERTCERGHKSAVLCGTKSQGCRTCSREDEDQRRRVRRDTELEVRRQKQQKAYAEDLKTVEDEIQHLRLVMKYEAEAEEHGKTLTQKQAQLQSLKETQSRMAAAAAVTKESRSAVSEQKPTKSDGASADNEGGCPSSSAQQEWQFMKRHEGAKNAALDELMELIGLESVKDEFLSVKSTIDTKIRQGLSLSNERLSCQLLGNPGTGKTTVARIWGRFLTLVGAIPGAVFKETTGAKLANDGISGCEALLEEIKDDGGGVLFIDEAYQLSSGHSPGGKAVMDYLLAEVENLRGKVIFVLAGYRKPMESFFAHNPGLPSRFPVVMSFDDYDDSDLLRILQCQMDKRYGGRMAVEGGLAGLFTRIAARRVGRGRGKEGFGNARAVENALTAVEKRQAGRLRRERRAGRAPDDWMLTQEDIMGPEPSAALGGCRAWQQLNGMVGLARVKQEVKVLLDSLVTNYQRELAEEPLVQFSLNRVFLGSPGTGKTTVAKLYGQILADLGFLSKGEVVVKSPADFVGSAMGQSEAQTKGILAATAGKVLVIDEAYGLYGGDGVTDPYRTAVVDTIVAEVQNVPGEDRCVVLLGYQEEMENMFQRVNPGLSRRFAIDTPFVFDDFDDEALQRIFELKLKASGFAATGQGKRVALEVLARERNRPNFGNGGAVENLLSRAKAGFQKRLSEGTAKKNLLEAVDFDEEFDRAEQQDTDVAMLFEGEVGRDKVVAFLQGLQGRVRQLRSLDLDPREEIPFSFLFRGPPGTGKTTTARKMGKVYYDMGFLSAATVVECSAADLIGEYVGHTGPKVRKKLTEARGRILFIDEAYRLAGGAFAQEAVDELVDSMTKPEYQGKLIIILAGYVDDINRLLSTNPGLSSRFPETIDFDPLGADDCVQLLASLFAKKRAELEKKNKGFDMTCLEIPSEAFGAEIVDKFRVLAAVDGWGSARDVKQLAKLMFRRVDLSSEGARLDEEHVRGELDKMLRDRLGRERRQLPTLAVHGPTRELAPRLSPRTETTGATDTAGNDESIADVADESPEEPEEPRRAGPRQPTRDAGVSQDVWDQLQRDRAAEARREAEYRKLKRAQAAAQGAERDRIVREILEEEERRRQEAAAKARLAAMGRCPMGYDWIKQTGGYRCAGGSHWIPDGEVDKK